MKALRRSNTSASASSSPTSPVSSSPPSSSWIHLRSLLVVTSAVYSSSSSSASSSAVSSPLSERGGIKSPWSRRKRKNALSPRQWHRLFTSNGTLRDGGSKLLKKVRSGGIDPSIRAEVWPFLLGVYDLSSSEDERSIAKLRKRKEYQLYRRQCQEIQISHRTNGLKMISEAIIEECSDLMELPDFSAFEDISARASLSNEESRQKISGGCQIENIEYENSALTIFNPVPVEMDSSDSESSEDDVGDAESVALSSFFEENENPDPRLTKSASLKDNFFPSRVTSENFLTWQRIMRLDAIRASADWVIFSPTQAAVSKEKALRAATSVGLKDFDHLEPCMMYHAARLVAVLEAYTIYDPETGYCQGMSDLLSPIVAVIEANHEAFWCFVGFMKKARHNFRLDEVGIQRQLKIVSKIIKCKDSHLYRHLEKLQAEDCFFVYRMVVVLFRRELTFEQTICLWEVMWADQAAIRAGIGRSTWARIRMRAPPTDDLLLYAIAASVLQRRKRIIEKYSSMDEILRECNSMTGHLDIWRLLDDAHDLVVNLHDKI